MAIDPVSFIPDGEEDLADWLSDTPIEEKEQAAQEVDLARISRNVAQASREIVKGISDCRVLFECEII